MIEKDFFCCYNKCYSSCSSCVFLFVCCYYHYWIRKCVVLVLPSFSRGGGFWVKLVAKKIFLCLSFQSLLLDRCPGEETSWNTWKVRDLLVGTYFILLFLLLFFLCSQICLFTRKPKNEKLEYFHVHFAMWVALWGRRSTGDFQSSLNSRQKFLSTYTFFASVLCIFSLWCCSHVFLISLIV